MRRLRANDEYRPGRLEAFGHAGRGCGRQPLRVAGQARLRQRIEPRVLHALEAGTHTTPLARFLAELCTARCAVYQGFSFGVADRLPYLPRVRFGKTILTHARWLLNADDLPRHGGPAAVWNAAFDAWRTRWRVPHRVCLVDHDRRLPVDLRRHPDRSVFRTRLQRAGRLELREASHPEDVAWLGRPHEILFPLTLDQSAPPTPPTARRQRPASPTHGHLSGDARILVARLLGHPARGKARPRHTPGPPRLLDRHLPHLPTPLTSTESQAQDPIISPDLTKYY